MAELIVGEVNSQEGPMTSTNSHVVFTCCLCALLHCVWKCHINVSDYWAELEITGVDVHP